MLVPGDIHVLAHWSEKRTSNARKSPGLGRKKKKETYRAGGISRPTVGGIIRRRKLHGTPRRADGCRLPRPCQSQFPLACRSSSVVASRSSACSEASSISLLDGDRLWLSAGRDRAFCLGTLLQLPCTEKAIGVELAAPVQQSSLLVTLVLSIWILGEYSTPCACSELPW